MKRQTPRLVVYFVLPGQPFVNIMPGEELLGGGGGGLVAVRCSRCYTRHCSAGNLSFARKNDYSRLNARPPPLGTWRKRHPGVARPAPNLYRSTENVRSTRVYLRGGWRGCMGDRSHTIILDSKRFLFLFFLNLFYFLLKISRLQGKTIISTESPHAPSRNPIN